MVGMLTQWLFLSISAVREIHVFFPIVGHSYLPPDKIFEKNEKKERRKVIIEANEYIFSKVTTVLDMKTDF